MVNSQSFVTMVALAVCFSLSLPGSQSASSPERTSQYVLGPGDQVKIWALGLEEVSDKPMRINPAGELDFPTVGQVHAAGQTLEQLKAILIQRFSKEVLHPQVSVEILEYGSQPVSVMGAVTKPGVHQLQGHKTLAQVLSMAEGLRPDAGPRIMISRQMRFGAIPLPNAKTDASGKYSVADVSVKKLMAGQTPAENIQILPNDVVTVPTSDVVYVMGEVKKPGEVLLKDRDSISVLQAYASAEGPGPQPAPQHAKIVRLRPDSPERLEIPVDLRAVQAGKAEDIAMRANDILIVPPSAPKKAILRVTEAAIQTVTGVIVWRRP